MAHFDFSCVLMSCIDYEENIGYEEFMQQLKDDTVEWVRYCRRLEVDVRNYYHQ